MATATSTETKAALDIVTTVAAAIKAAVPQGIPSGYLYAQLMPAMSLETFTKIVGILVESDIITNRNHLLKYEL